MIEVFSVELPHRVSLVCRAAGPEDAPVLLFLHGFPEAAFVWDDMLRHFGSRYRCIAPNLRGYDRSSAPEEVEAYRAKHLVADIAALVAQLGGPVAALVAHDWGGAVAWNFAVQHPGLLERLVIINSPHPATFLRDLQHDPAQQAASAYMNFLVRPDAEALLEEDDYRRLRPFFAGRHAGEDVAHEEPAWLTPAVQEQYRDAWLRGLRGPLNYYRASPLRPPTPDDDSVMKVELKPEWVTVRVPTWVIWGEEDSALLPRLLDGLEDYVPRLRVVRIPDASHWVVHEQPQRVAREIEAALAVPVAAGQTTT